MVAAVVVVVLKAHLNVSCASGLSIHQPLWPSKQMPAVLASAKAIGHYQAWVASKYRRLLPDLELCRHSFS